MNRVADEDRSLVRLAHQGDFAAFESLVSKYERRLYSVALWKESPEQIAIRREAAELVSAALDELDDKYRLVFLLRDVEGLSTAETAEALEISEANVKVRLLRARLMLRERLTRAFGDEAARVELHGELE
jgi:RNA polymerase sigma factor (sigma-70 family)